MQAVINGALIRRVLGMATVIVLTAAGPAFADKPVTNPPPTTTQSTAANNNGDLSAAVKGVIITYPSGAPGSGSRAITSVDVSWTPPPCWIGPVADPATFKRKLLDAVEATNVPGQANYILQSMDELRRHYEEGFTWDGSGEGYTDFNLDQQGKGMFWGAVVNPDSTSLDRFNCNSNIPFFVPNGQLPPPGTPNVITPEMLSKIAYAHTQVPGVTIETKPVGVQTVNVPTWVTLQEKYTPVKVRASVDLGGGQEIWAETTATAQSVHIEPGTPDATVYPASGDCPIRADGTVGAAYSGDPAAEPPCGVAYLRSTDVTGPFELNVTATWKVSWTGSGGAGNALPDGRIQQPQQVTVQEIQTINR